MYNEWGKRGMCIGFWWESQKETTRKDLDIVGRIILKCILKIWVGWYGRE
jgi:hypothetical protein